MRWQPRPAMVSILERCRIMCNHKGLQMYWSYCMRLFEHLSERHLGLVCLSVQEPSNRCACNPCMRAAGAVRQPAAHPHAAHRVGGDPRGAC